jgi:hypothetical protein
MLNANFFSRLLFLMWCGWILLVSGTSPATNPSERSGKATTLPTSRPGNASGIALAIFGDADSAVGLRGRWPENYNVFTDVNEESITVYLPDGRAFSHWSHMTDVIRDERTITAVLIWPLAQPESIGEAKRSLEGILKNWQIKPTGDIARILNEMDGTRPAICAGDRGDMDLSPDARFDVDVRACIGSKPITYVIVLGFGVSSQWYFDPQYREAHRVKTAQTNPAR